MPPGLSTSRIPVLTSSHGSSAAAASAARAGRLVLDSCPMRIGVVGAGAVGGAIAALLARGGHDVEVTARGEHLEAMRRGGLELRGAWGDFTAEVTANDVLTRAPELAIVATKAQDA